MPLSMPQAFAALMGIAAIVTVLLTSDPAVRVLAIALAGVASFATRSLPEAATALLIFLAFLAIDAAPTSVIFSGFTTGGFWLLVGGLVIGSAITASGLGDQIADRIFAHTGTSYMRAVWVLSVGGVLLGALVPSAIPRVIVMMPITLALAQRMGFASGSRAQAGLLMASATMTLVPTFAFLTANLPTIIELGTIEILYGSQVSYGAFFVQNLPINALRFAVLLVLLRAYEQTTGKDNAWAGKGIAADPMTPAQRWLLLILFACVALWATDTLHGIAPAWVALGAALVLLLPQLGVFAADAMKTQIDLSIAFLIAAVFAISAVMTQIGLGEQIADLVVPALHLGQDFAMWDLFAIIGFSSGLSHLTIAPAAPIVLAPLAGPMSSATGWSVETVAMAQNIGFSTTAFPFQSPPLLIAIAMAQIPVGALTRLCLNSTLIVSAIGIPLTWLWWHWLGLV